MLFNSFRFVFLFFPAVFLISTWLKGRRLLAWIAVSSFIFYSFAGHVWFLGPMLATIVLDFILAQKMAKTKKARLKKAILIFSIGSSLGLLIYFKYAGFLSQTIAHFTWLFFGSPNTYPELFHTLLPAGISFYTFQTISYMVDVYQGKAEPETNFWRFASFVSFFPHLVAGPLTRHHQLIPALKNIEHRGFSPAWKAGIFLFVIGLSKKVLIADRIAEFIDPLIQDIAHSGFVLSWVSLLGFTFQIYFDFSGYTDMAIGLGRLFGVELPKNFHDPYQAVNPSDFWKRWHVTLSQWFRDYLYIPLGGGTSGSLKTFRNLLLTMMLAGLWHGAQWTFMAWGLYHGLLLALYHGMKPIWDKQDILIQKTVSFLLVCLGWVFFRSLSLTDALQWYQNLFGFKTFALDFPVMRLLQILGLLAIAFLISHLKFNASNSDRLHTLGVRAGILLGSLAVLDVLFMNQSARFLYFQF